MTVTLYSKNVFNKFSKDTHWIWDEIGQLIAVKLETLLYTLPIKDKSVSLDKIQKSL